MVSKTQVASQIRFHLEQLSAKNAHHDFEHLCRHLARERICSNIIPSTGPVSAGGDQGKDFETFLTYLRASPISDLTFVGMISEKPIVFACSIQKRGILGKIRSDVNKIMKNGTSVSVESIFFFSLADISTSKREELKSWAKDTHSSRLEIIDGQAISEMLADRDVFWIAVEYLHIPSDIYPRAEKEENWYTQTLNFWRADQEVPQNYADFFEIKSATRHATFDKNVKQDLLFWISLLKQFLNAVFPLVLRRNAIYEIAVASLRGLGTLIGQEEDLRAYFAVISNLESRQELEDAGALLNYCIGAVLRNQVQLTIEEIGIWRDQLLTKVEQKLHQSRTPNQKCPLLEIRGYLALQLDPKTEARLDWEGAIEWWTHMINIAKDAPLFPLERFSDRLTKYTRFIGSCPGYDYLSQQTDILLSQRGGEARAAEKCKDRALEFLNTGKPLKAIDQLHKAKVKWFSEETIGGSLLSMLVISQSYRELGLCLAAKYYALAAASIALQSAKPEIKPSVPKALSLAAECDYVQGSWCGYLELVESELSAYAAFAKHESNSNGFDEFQRILFNITTITAVTSVLDSNLHSFLEEKTKKWNLNEWLDEILQKAYYEWKKLNVSEIWKRLQEQLLGRPFGDLGKMRVIAWSELGVTWTASWKNDYETTPVAEQLIAVLQILLADIADIDLCLLKTNVDISIRRGNVDNVEVKALPSNTGRKWEVIFPNSNLGKQPDWQGLQINMLTAAIYVLSEISLLPTAEFQKKLEDIFRNGISMKTFVAKPYEMLYRDFITKDVFDSGDKCERKIPCDQLPFRIEENSALSWRNGPGPGYSREKATELLKNRYSNAIIPIRHTLESLQKSAEFGSLIKRLRSEGWLDWHILASINNVAVSYRVRQILGSFANPIEERDLCFRMMNEPEREDILPIPVSEFSEEKLKMALQVSMISTIKVLGLESRQRTPDFDGISYFLRNRYNYWTDDISHEDPFPS